ncbi:SRPBCC family protein [Mycolicibacterium brumae]|uniref:ATPase n=1 Tax=Mycolicibacterium brumae TaxID=85968 RepID=A0A2G5P8F9_9MYCO|nr:SRPBCC family protein [Mycolicibacterium brumae]MCV7193881.1 SRPBCC domain-containing protein [Mycolicibacterium brumae]PIB74632.1 ATPase [Mycolicibacterium brumae]RWA21799.1 hypothetical protein MBRU_13930 [Mycolicibacterium brumae DSM 44177]UWW08134.1 SRPBCC domain-containing protein [Mycolicibacterium brumae]
MPITEVVTDTDALTLTVIADFPVGVQRLWDAYLDPRQIERFWGPPEYPATFLRHDGYPGGRTHYRMVGPDGAAYPGYWEWVAVDAPRSFEVRDGFADADGTPNTEMPTTRMIFEFSETPDGARLVTTTTFGSLADLEQLKEMGMEEGMRAAMGQIDAIVADLSSFAADQRTQLQRVGDTQARVSRVIAATPEQLWHAHHDPELMKRWMIGPDGWALTVCEPAAEVGARYRWHWDPVDGGAGFGFTGELLAAERPWREVTTEAMTTAEDPDAANSWQTVNELTFTPVAGGTLLTLLISYPDAELREQILATGMVDGMEASYARLEAIELG